MLFGLAALAIDVVSWELSSERAQATADQAALSAGVASEAGTNITTEGQAVASSNGFINGTGGVTVIVSQPPITGAYKGMTGAIQVTITQPQSLILSKMVLANGPAVTARAVVMAGAGACVIVLGTSGSTATMSGNITISQPTCDFDNNSISASGTALSGSGGIDAENVYLSGSYTTSGSMTVKATDTLQTYGPPVADPYAGRTIPSYTGCNQSAVTISSSKTFNAGSSPYVFCGSITASGSGTLTFGAGVYVFNQASLITSGVWTINATNATLIFTSSTGSSIGSITASGTTTLNLSAPTTGASAGIAIWVDKKAVNSSLVLSGASSFSLTGAIYAPTTSLFISGIGNSSCTQLVAKSITFSGSSTLRHNCAGDGVSDPGGLALVE